MRNQLGFTLSIALAFACTDQPIAPTELADPPAPSLSTGPVVHHVSLGGADVCEALGQPTGCDANFSVHANEFADGSVKGQWQDTFGGGNGYHAVVNCMNIVGNGAVLSGVVSSSFGAAPPVGTPAIMAVRDNGTSANDPPDQITFGFTFPGAPPCTALDPDDFAGFYLDLAKGQVKVR